MIYRLYIRIDTGQIKYKDMNWDQLVIKVRQVMDHPKVVKFWIRHKHQQKHPGKYMILRGTQAKPIMQIKWMN